jgi:hypothetical protein
MFIFPLLDNFIIKSRKNTPRIKRKAHKKKLKENREPNEGY